MDKDEAWKLALEALEIQAYNSGDEKYTEAITAIKQALAAPVQEPVAWRAWFDADSGARWLFTLWPEEERLDVEWQPLYATPPAQPAPVPLTDDQVDAATKAWFENDIVAGRNPFKKQIHTTFTTTHKITEKGQP
jgi:hypothetical protein